ncbi:hypothetical protein [Aureitalea marina]|uniref:TonB-dependent receptor n=1 Tax=Aureitalea marina TaxID=930804 RepID=A0A2S7KSL0_9FLAO|nr:hypothetical protein [Aureitalea marina]PQB05615.1 hypothetical protein BST85_12440 [Aureitalea marina]
MTSSIMAQSVIIHGRVYEEHSMLPLQGVEVQFLDLELKVQTNTNGEFVFPPQSKMTGHRQLQFSLTGYRSLKLNMIVEDQDSIGLDPIIISVDINSVEDSSSIIELVADDVDRAGFESYTSPQLLSSSKDVFTRAAAYDFSATFFRQRGLGSRFRRVLINGQVMNDPVTGLANWSLWGGLNDGFRRQELFPHSRMSPYHNGSLAGVTSFQLDPMLYPKRTSVTASLSNRNYGSRIIGSYFSGLLRNNWSIGLVGSLRSGQGYFEGSAYQAYGVMLMASKQLTDRSSLVGWAAYTPTIRGLNSSLTNEVSQLKSKDYNPNWGWMGDRQRNSRERSVRMPLGQLSYRHGFGNGSDWAITLGYAHGYIGTTRIDYGGTQARVTTDGQTYFIGGGRNPRPDYYQNLPSYQLREAEPSPIDYQNALLSQSDFESNGQLDWEDIFSVNSSNALVGNNAVYIQSQDRQQTDRIWLSSQFNSAHLNHYNWRASLSILRSRDEFFAYVVDELLGHGFLDIDQFADAQEERLASEVAQSDLRNPNRIVRKGDKYKYNYVLNTNSATLDFWMSFRKRAWQVELGVNGGVARFQREGLYENGLFPGGNSLGKSDPISLSNFGLKLMGQYRLEGRHVIDLDFVGILETPPARSIFINPRQNNFLLTNLQNEKYLGLNLGYHLRYPGLKIDVSAYGLLRSDYNRTQYYFTEDIAGRGKDNAAFVQEELSGISSRHIGFEWGVEWEAMAGVSMRTAGSVGQFIYINNPEIFLHSEDFQGYQIGSGKSSLSGYHLPVGPQTAIQFGIDYRSEDFFWIGCSANYFARSFTGVSALARSSNFHLDYDGLPIVDYDPHIAKRILAQKKLPDFVIFNLVGGKSWLIDGVIVGVFVSLNNVLNHRYVTGARESSRYANYREAAKDLGRLYGPLFGIKSFPGMGTTYFLNIYLKR